MSEIPDDIMQAASKAYFDAFDENDQASIHTVLRNIGQVILVERQRADSYKALCDELAKAGDALIADVRARYPGEELRCQYMRALDAALVSYRKEKDARSGKGNQ